MNEIEFEKFSHICAKELPNEMDKILNAAKGEKTCAIGFITVEKISNKFLMKYIKQMVLKEKIFCSFPL